MTKDQMHKQLLNSPSPCDKHVSNTTFNTGRADIVTHEKASLCAVTTNPLSSNTWVLCENSTQCHVSFDTIVDKKRCKFKNMSLSRDKGKNKNVFTNTNVEHNQKSDWQINTCDYAIDQCNSDKYQLDLRFRPRHRQNIAKAKNVDIFKQWDGQLEYKYGFIQLSEMLVPNKNEKKSNFNYHF